jgi:hypothetical protein
MDPETEELPETEADTQAVAGLGDEVGGLGAVKPPPVPPAPVAPMREALREAPRAPPRRLVVDHTRERMRSGIGLSDPYDIADIMRVYAPTRGDPSKGNIDNEIDFNWKRYETYGRRDYSELREYHNQGWREVAHESFPGRFAPEGTTGPVIVRDMILMERPMRLTVKARNEEIDAATRAMRVNRQNLGTTPEGQAPRIVIADRTSREAIPIPE